MGEARFPFVFTMSAEVNTCLLSLGSDGQCLSFGILWDNCDSPMVTKIPHLPSIPVGMGKQGLFPSLLLSASVSPYLVHLCDDLRVLCEAVGWGEGQKQV